MPRSQPLWLFLIGLLVVDVAAQEEPAVTPAPTVCLQLFCESDRVDRAPAPNERLELVLRLMPPRPPPRPQYTYPFEKYHGRFHNDRLHPWVVTPITSYRDEHSPFFKHWNSSRKGFDLIQFGAGRVGLGVETERVVVNEADRRSSSPLGSDGCYASGFQYSSACYSVSYREGDRRYGVSVRIYFGRRR